MLVNRPRTSISRCAVGIENTWVVGAGGGERLTGMSDEVLRL